MEKHHENIHWYHEWVISSNVDVGDVGLSCNGRKIKDNNVRHESPITKYEWSH